MSLGKILSISSELGYEQYLVTASHDNAVPGFMGIISGSTSYYGVHITAIINSYNLPITQGTLNNPLKITQNNTSHLLFTFTPLGRASKTLNLSMN